MLNNQAQAALIVSLLSSADAADTAAATSAWIDARPYEGDLMFVVDTGVVTAGQVVWTVEHADDDSGTNAESITPNEGTFDTVTTANDPLVQKRTVSANAVRGYVRIVGTITTGPVQCSAAVLSAIT